MNNNDRITYEEFMIMFKNAPRMAYMLYDKAEDEIDKYKNVINKIKEKIKEDITFCENDSQGVYDKCNIQIKRMKNYLELLEEVE